MENLLINMYELKFISMKCSKEACIAMLVDTAGFEIIKGSGKRSRSLK